jgi:Flp pilus assembly protein TadG
VVLAAILAVVMLGIIAFGLDLGYLFLVRTQLQTAADSSALAAAASTNLPRGQMEAVARQYASYHQAAGRAVQLNPSDIEYGNWDTTTRVFTTSATVGNAVRVTTRTSASTGGATPFFLARIFNHNSLDQSASAVAMTNPRDIAFVIDLSGSMNFDTDPDNTASINSTFAAQGYPTIGTDLMQQVYSDFGFGTFPGTTQCIGQPLGISTSNGDPLSQLMSTSGPLSNGAIPSAYRITSSDSWSVRQQKAFRWAMDIQLPLLMPAAKPKAVAPALTSSTYYSYWADYFNDYYKKLGYRSYVNFMMYNGRDGKPDGARYTPLSQSSPDCPWHSESTAGGTFSFPPREQPTHAARRAMIAAMQVIKERNQNISDMNQRDWVSIITFDRLTGASPAIPVPLTGDYDAAMRGCTPLQAVGHNGASTATEVGLIAARNHIKPSNQGGFGRLGTNKVVVLLTDGMPNLYSSSATAISSYRTSYPSSNFYGSANAKDAPLMQASMMQRDHWYLYPVGIGLDCDYSFMDRMARMGETDKNGQGPRGSGNPADYEARLTEIFQNIITNPKLRIVQ